jgi:hypothetical protein
MYVGTCAKGDTVDSKAPLDLDVASALKRMRKVEEEGALKTCGNQVSTDADIHGDNSVDSHLKKD